MVFDISNHFHILPLSRSVIVHVYAVKNDITNDIRNLREEKKFVTNGEFINRLRLNLNEIPTVLVDGKPINQPPKYLPSY